MKMHYNQSRSFSTNNFAKARNCTFATALLAALLSSSAIAGSDEIGLVQSPAQGSGAALYTGNREPLIDSPLIKLPIGSITPGGWLRHQLELEKAGMTGHLEEISKWCQFNGNAWSSPDGQ